MAAPTAAALADVHSEPATNRARLGQFVLILKLRPFVLDLPATLASRSERRVELLIDHPRRLPVPIPAVFLSRTTTRPARLRLRLTARERRRLTLPRTPCLLQLALELPDPCAQPLVLPREPHQLVAQPLVLGRQLRAPHQQRSQLIHRLAIKHLNPGRGDGNHRHPASPQAT